MKLELGEKDKRGRTLARVRWSADICNGIGETLPEVDRTEVVVRRIRHETSGPSARETKGPRAARSRPGAFSRCWTIRFTEG